MTINLYPPLDRDEEMLDFSEPIIGMKPGEDKTFSLPVPDTERYGEFRGKTAEFKVHLHQPAKARTARAGRCTGADRGRLRNARRAEG